MFYMNRHTRIVSNLFLVPFILILLFVSKSDASKVEADLGKHNIPVEVDFAGTSVLLFGSIVDDANDPKQGRPDVIIVVRGPNRDITVRRKSRVAGIWINADNVEFENVPGYYAIVTNKPVNEIASSYELRESEIGFNSLQSSFLLSSAGFSSTRGQEYSSALIRVMRQNGLYQEHVGDVGFPGRHLFRAEFDLPSNVPLGLYNADIFIFRNGSLEDKFTTSLKIEKQGIERYVFGLAHEWPLVYGILAVIIAVVAGLTAAAVFAKK